MKSSDHRCLCLTLCVFEERACVGVQRKRGWQVGVVEAASDTQQRKIPT